MAARALPLRSHCQTAVSNERSGDPCGRQVSCCTKIVRAPPRPIDRLCLLYPSDCCAAMGPQRLGVRHVFASCGDLAPARGATTPIAGHGMLSERNSSGSAPCQAAHPQRPVLFTLGLLAADPAWLDIFNRSIKQACLTLQPEELCKVVRGESFA